MAKLIKLTQEHLQDIFKEFSNTMKTARLIDGKVQYTKILGVVDRKATLIFTEKAWMKMQTLVRTFDKEVAWHGVATRGEDETKDEYLVSDIMVYPQKVTGSTVNTDQAKYQTWLYKFDDEVFNNIRFQGHSHVNFGASPSPVDITHQNAILNMLSDDMFYIFVIWNKKGSYTIKIYDMKKNILFEADSTKANNDISVKIGVDDDIDEFIKESKNLVVDKPIYQHPATSTPYTGYSSAYGSGYQYGYGVNKNNSVNQPKNTNETHKKTNEVSSASGKKSDKKGKRKRNISNYLKTQ